MKEVPLVPRDESEEEASPEELNSVGTTCLFWGAFGLAVLVLLIVLLIKIIA